MFKLLKLAFYALVGYAIYEFLRGAMGGEMQSAWNRVTEAAQGGGGGGGGQRAGGGPRNLHQRDPARANMTGPGEGQFEATQETDGGSVRHAVGRGVVRR